MFKNLILLAFCAPLVLTAVSEVQRLLDIYAGEQPSEPIDTLKKEEDADPSQQFDQIPKEVRAAVAAVQDHAPVAPEEDPASERKLTRPVHKLIEAVQHHAVALWYTQALLDACADGGPPPKLDKFPESYKTLLEEFSKARGTAELAWTDVEKRAPHSQVDNLYGALNSWKPHDPSIPAADEIVDGAARLNKFLKDHPGARQAAEAQTQLALREQGVKLARLLDKADAQADVPALFKGLGELLARKPELAKLDDTLRKTAQKLCDLVFPVEDFDALVIVQFAGGGSARVDRKTLTINLINPEVEAILRVNEDKKTDDGILLYDEFEPPERERIESFFVDGTTKHPPENKGEPPLVGTPYSKAVHAYNKVRKGIKPLAWNAAALRKLQEVCNRAEHREALEAHKESDLLKRVQEVSQAIHDHPDLFPDSP